MEVLVILACLATIPIVYYQEKNFESLPLTLADWLVWLVFLTEYLILLTIAESKGKYVRSNWLSASVGILSFPPLPALMGLVRLVRSLACYGSF